jgi:hypothetical protein
MTDDYTEGDRLMHITGERAKFVRYSEDLGTRTALVVFDGAEDFPTHVPLGDIRPA